MKYFYILIFIIIFNLPYNLLYTQKINNQDIFIYADKKKYNYKDKYWDLIGESMIKSGNDTLKADSIKYFTDDNKGIANGNVRLFDYDNTIETFGKYGEYYKDQKYAKLLTDTKLFAIKDQIVIHSQVMERYGETKTYIASDKVKIELLKDDAVIYANKGIYEIEKKIVTLTENAKIVQNNVTYLADKIILYTSDKLLILQGHARIVKKKQQVLADKIEYYSNHPEKVAVLTGKPHLIEYSKDDSMLSGEPFRTVTAKKIVYHNVGEGKAILTGDVQFSELYIAKEKENNSLEVKFIVYKREGRADTIKYFGGINKKYSLLGNAKIYEPYRAGFADRIDYFDDFAVLKENAFIYEFFKRSDLKYSYSPSKLKRKGLADTIKYFADIEKIELIQNAKVIEKDLTIYGDVISYTAGNIEKGFAKGNAKIIKLNEWAKADLIEYENNQEKVVLIGNAKYKKKELYAQADYMEHSDKAKKTILKGKAWIYDKKDKKQAIGERIEYIKKDKEELAYLYGNPKLIRDNKEAKANFIEYKKYGDNEQLYLNERAVYKAPDKTVYADQIVYYTIKIEDEETKDEKILLKKNVRIEDDTRLTFGDNGEFYFSNKPSNKYEKGILTGHCKVFKKQENQVARSNQINYFKDNNSETITLKGNADFVDDNKAGYSEDMIINPNYEYKGKKVDKITMIGNNPRIENKDSYTKGDKIEIIDGAYNHIIVYQNVEYVNKEEGKYLSSGYLFFDEDKEYIRAEKDPIYIDKEDEVTVYSDLIESYRGKKESIATGDVKIVQEGKTIYGEWSKFYEEKSELEVTGNATLVEKDNISRAKRIILNTKEKSIELIGVQEGQVDTRE